MSATMRAAQLDFETHTLEVTSIPVPQPGAGEVRVRVKAAGVCLSDVHLVNGQIKPTYRSGGKVVIGHEVSGVVDVPGPDVAGWSVGDRVTLYPIIDRADGPRTQGVDYDGGWAEHVVVPASVLVALPDSVPFDQGAILPDAVSTPWGAVASTAQVRPGQSAGVWGLGGLGVHAVQILRAPCYEFAHFTDEELADSIILVHDTIDGWSREELVAALRHWRDKGQDIKRVWESGRWDASTGTVTGKWEYEVSKTKLAEALWPALLGNIRECMASREAPVPPIVGVVIEAYRAALHWRDASFVLTEVPVEPAPQGS